MDIANIRRLCLKLECVRSGYGPMEIVSGYRCQIHNLEVDGARFSRHMDGKAADIKVLTDGDRFRLVQALMKNGFRRIGIGKTIIHADIDESAPYPCCGRTTREALPVRCLAACQAARGWFEEWKLETRIPNDKSSPNCPKCRTKWGLSQCDGDTSATRFDASLRGRVPSVGLSPFWPSQGRRQK